MVNKLNEIDAGIRDLIIMLNNEGFKTEYSCAGHPTKQRFYDLPANIQELMLCVSKQLNKKITSLISNLCSGQGYISFYNSRDAIAVYKILKKTKYKNRFYLSKRIVFDGIGLSQTEINDIWKKAYKKLIEEL